MCRRDLLLGVGLMAFGAGLLLAGWIESTFLRWLLGLGLVASGFFVLQKK